jgi:tubulysin polyketide synthase-like protein
VTARQLLTAARAAGIRVEVRGDRLVYDAPRGALTSELREALVQHKPALLALLTPVEFVTLNGGLTVPVPALRLTLDLEARGIPLASDANHQFIVPTDDRLTPADLAAIRRWHAHLGAIIEYRVPEV